MPAKPPRKPQAGRAASRLDAYRRKRDFQATPEPSGEAGTAAGSIFVVQEHHARSHHFDLRLEIDGVLASWAVPKGIPTDPSMKRLAVKVEDHPLDYADFAGEIPSGHYGAGTVAIWDRGTWSPLDRKWRAAYDRGKLKIRFHGDKLRGPYLLTRMGDAENWLLRMLDAGPATTGPYPPPEREMAAFIPPQLARPVTSPPTGDEWVHELKYDGYRITAVRIAGEVSLFTRKGIDWTDRFGGLATRLAGLPAGDFILDGEAVVLDSRGRTRFSALQAALKDHDTDGIRYVAFDLLHHRGDSLRDLPLVERQRRLAEFIGQDGPALLSRTWPGGAGADLLRQTCELEMEGIISKRLHGVYRPGQRVDWVKSKCRPRQEFIILGYTAPQGSCAGFGALVLASMEKGRLVPRGKVGTGFTTRQRKSLLAHMRPLVTSSDGDVTWLRPELVAEIEYAELTRDGSIRHGSFVSLREDKPASDVQIDPMDAAAGMDTSVAGIPITHPDRIVFPEDGITKLAVVRYHEQVADLLLPHVADRPLAVLRAPDGIGGDTFFQKGFKGHLPPHVRMRSLDDGSRVIVVRDSAGLAALGQFGVIEFHPWGSRLPQVEKPDVLVWDLDPDREVPWEETCGAALLLRDVLSRYDIETRVKTSGGKGLHVMMHLRRHHTWEVLKPFTKAVAARVASENPARFTIRSSLARRKGRIYIDWLRNGRGATCIAPWSLRARPGATISRPIDWGDLIGLPASGFSLHDPVREPLGWRGITPRHLPIQVIREVTAGM